MLWISSERQLEEMLGSLCQVYVVLQLSMTYWCGKFFFLGCLCNLWDYRKFCCGSSKRPQVTVGQSAVLRVHFSNGSLSSLSHLACSAQEDKHNFLPLLPVTCRNLDGPRFSGFHSHTWNFISKSSCTWACLRLRPCKAVTSCTAAQRGFFS